MKIMKKYTAKFMILILVMIAVQIISKGYFGSSIVASEINDDEYYEDMLPSEGEYAQLNKTSAYITQIKEGRTGIEVYCSNDVIITIDEEEQIYLDGEIVSEDALVVGDRISYNYVAVAPSMPGYSYGETMIIIHTRKLSTQPPLPTQQPIPTETHADIRGDLNGDGYFDLSDVEDALSCALNISTRQHLHMQNIGKNEAGRITLSDCSNLLKAVLGIE